MANLNIPHHMKDSRWLQLEVCREAQRSKCTRPDEECKFAHPPPHVEIQNGRVTACYDAIKGRCSRENPPCKYYHPPQHLKDQLLINGRNHLAMKNILVQQMQMSAVTNLQPQMQMQPQLTMMNPYYNPGPAAFNTGNPYLNTSQGYMTSSPSPGPSGPGMSSHGLGDSGSSSPMTSYGTSGMFQQQQNNIGGNKSRNDRLEVCREYARRNCRRPENECRYAHPAEHVQVTDNMVVVCMDSLKGKCGRETCRYFHPPAHLVQQLKSRQSVNTSGTGETVGSIGVTLAKVGAAANISVFSPSAVQAAAAAVNVASSEYGALMAQAASSPFLAAAALLQQKQTIAMLMAAAQSQQLQAAPSVYAQSSGVQNATAAAAGFVPSWPFSVPMGANSGLKRKASFDQDAELVFHGLAPSVKRQTMSPSALSGSSLAFLQHQQQQSLQAMYGLGTLGPLLSSFQHSLTMHPQYAASMQMAQAAAVNQSHGHHNFQRHNQVTINEVHLDPSLEQHHDGESEAEPHQSTNS